MKWLALLTFALVPTSALAGELAGEMVALWPDGFLEIDPKAKPETPVVSKWREKWTIIRLQNVSKPIITVYRPKGATAPTAAVVICPGGGYGILAYDLEGTEVAEWLNGLGITGVLLKYRVPRQRDGAFQDAQRAMGIVRHRAKEWGIDPKKIGILGFSAGGHLAARVCTNYQKRAYKPVDAADEVSCRPDFAIPIYPAYMEKDGGLDTETLPVTKDTPPTFIAIACNDRFTAGALHYFLALRKAKVTSELHVFQDGSHGCGLRPVDEGAATWPVHCEKWFRAIGVLGK